MRAPRSCQSEVVLAWLWSHWAPRRHRGRSPSSSGGLDLAALPVPGDVGGLGKLRLSHSKGNAPKICAKMLLSCNRSWAVPRRCKSEFLYLLLRRQRCVICVCVLHILVMLGTGSSLGHAAPAEAAQGWLLLLISKLQLLT